MKANYSEHDANNGRELIESSVSVDDVLRKVLINHLTVESPELFELLSKCNNDVERTDETRKVIDLGAFVKSKVQMAVDTDYFDRRVGEMTGEFEKGLESVKGQLLSVIAEKFDPAKSDSYSEKIQRFFTEKKAEFAKQIQDALDELVNGKRAICNKINESFDVDVKTSHISRFMESVDKLHLAIKKDFDMNQSGSITHQMKQLIEETLGENGELAKSIDHRLSFDNPRSTIAILQSNLMKKLDEIKTELAASRSAAEAERAVLEKSTQKGFDFEDVLMDSLEKFAQQRGDLVERVGKTCGEVSGSKKGDFVYTVTSLNKTIAIDAKNTKMPTPGKLLVEMDETCVNRKADYVLYIYADESQLHKQVGVFQEYPSNKAVTHFGLWEVAMRIAISRLTIESEAIDGIDRVAVESEIEAIKNALTNFRSIKTAATNILKESNRIASQADLIQTEVNASLHNLTSLLFDKDENYN